MTTEQTAALAYSKAIGDAITTLHLAGVLTDGERDKVVKRYRARMAKNGVAVTRTNVAGEPDADRCESGILVS